MRGACLLLVLTLALPAALSAQGGTPVQLQSAQQADTAVLGPQEIGTLRMGQTRNGLLEPGDWTMGDGTWADIWYVEATAGQRIIVELRSRRFDAYLQLLDPWGNKLADDDDSGGNGDARITYTVREPGRYQVIVNNFGDTQQVGPYTLALR